MSSNIGSIVSYRGETYRCTVHIHIIYITVIIITLGCRFGLKCSCCLKKNVVVVVVVVVSHIQRISCQPEKTTLHGSQSRSWYSIDW